MRSSGSTPRDLAKVVAAYLRKSKAGNFHEESLHKLFQVLYFASQTAEERQPITSHIVFMDPANPDPDPPPRIVKDRWSYIPLSRKLPLTVRNLKKIALASDPRSSSFAIYPDRRGSLWIWGLIDQAHGAHRFATFDAESGPERPGLFQAAIKGVGHIAAYSEYEIIGELRVDRLVTFSQEVLRGGPVYAKLQPYISSHLRRVYGALPQETDKLQRSWLGHLQEDWITTLCRLILRIQAYGHGGALLLTPTARTQYLHFKYRLGYQRLKSALDRRGVLVIRRRRAWEQIRRPLDRERLASVPFNLYLEESVSEIDLSETIDLCISNGKLACPW